MSSYTGLYYPFIRFENEDWLKVSALYWDKIGRIVPQGYPVNDSELVRELIGELNFIPSYKPDYVELDETSKPFMQLLNNYGSELKNKYGFNDFGGDTVTYVLGGGKMHKPLKQALIDEGLMRKYDFDENDEFLTMHPELMHVYMTALAQEMSNRRQLHPLADNVVAHISIGNTSIEILSQLLLEDVEIGQKPITIDDVKERLGILAINMVMPSNINNIPVKKIIEIRNKHKDEFTNFQNGLHSIIKNNDWIVNITNEEQMNEQLLTLYTKHIEPSKKEISKIFKSFSIETFAGLVSSKFVAPQAVTGTYGLFQAFYHLPEIYMPFAFVASASIGIRSVLKDRQKEATTNLKTSPASYLMRIDEHLNPSSLSQGVSKLRKFTYGV